MLLVIELYKSDDEDDRQAAREILAVNCDPGEKGILDKRNRKAVRAKPPKSLKPVSAAKAPKAPKPPKSPRVT